MTDTLKSINTTPHLCRSKVKQTALEIAAAIRPANKFNRVGMSFVERIEAKVRAANRVGGVTADFSFCPTITLRMRGCNEAADSPKCRRRKSKDNSTVRN